MVKLKLLLVIPTIARYALCDIGSYYPMAPEGLQRLRWYLEEHDILVDICTQNIGKNVASDTFSMLSRNHRKHRKQREVSIDTTLTELEDWYKSRKKKGHSIEEMINELTKNTPKPTVLHDIVPEYDAIGISVATHQHVVTFKNHFADLCQEIRKGSKTIPIIVGGPGSGILNCMSLEHLSPLISLFTSGARYRLNSS